VKIVQFAIQFKLHTFYFDLEVLLNKLNLIQLLGYSSSKCKVKV